MGYQLHVTCSNCTVNRTESLGTGFRGVKYFLCACQHCRKFVRAKQDLFMTGPDGEPAPMNPSVCFRCKKPLLVITPKPGNDESFDRVVDLGRCPRCGGHLTGTDTGLMWD